MKIEAVDAFYLRMAEVLAVGDGRPDALITRQGHFRTQSNRNDFLQHK